MLASLLESLGQWMGPPHHMDQAITCHMRIYLGGRDVGMTQQCLDAAQVRAPLHQVGGEGVAQNMRRHFFRVQTGLERQPLEQLVKTSAGEKTAFAA